MSAIDVVVVALCRCRRDHWLDREVELLLCEGLTSAPPIGWRLPTPPSHPQPTVSLVARLKGNQPLLKVHWNVMLPFLPFGCCWCFWNLYIPLLSVSILDATGNRRVPGILSIKYVVSVDRITSPTTTTTHHRVSLLPSYCDRVKSLCDAFETPSPATSARNSWATK